MAIGIYLNRCRKYIFYIILYGPIHVIKNTSYIIILLVSDHFVVVIIVDIVVENQHKF